MANEPKADRAYAAAHFALSLGKEQCGVIRSLEGGGVKVDATSYRGGGHHDTWRQLGKPKFEAIKLQVGMAVAQPFTTWITAAFNGDFVRKNGAIQAADFFYKERARREFKEAIISEITLPALNAADKNAAYMGVTIAPETIVFTKGDGNTLQPPQFSEKQKLWSCCNFKFFLDNWGDFRRVTKIDAITVKTTVVETHVGGQLEPYKIGTRMEYPSITFTMPEADVHTMAKTFQDYWMNKIPPAPTNGHIEYLDNELKKPLATLNFTGANVVSITPDRSDATSEELKMVKVEIVTETMKFEYAT